MRTTIACLASSLQHLALMAPTPPLGPYVGMTDEGPYVVSSFL